MLNKSYVYLLNVIGNRKLDKIIITITDQSGGALEIEDNVHLTGLINR